MIKSSFKSQELTNPIKPPKYDHKRVEHFWRTRWGQEQLDVSDIGRAKNPFYNLMMFPYPSAEGLHVGNMYAFTGSDIYGRFKRMQGYSVFEPIGLDGFGIHSENYALKIGRHPMEHAKITQKNFYNQLHKIGAMFDWTRTVETYDPDYYRWTQWIFIQMFKHGLAYRGKAQVNWCPVDKTVLADEQVLSAGRQGLMGVCERCGNKVEKKLLEQWFFRITAYAGKLLENLSQLDWSEKVKIAQKNWIGKKEGINITYQVKDSKKTIVCFTTTPVNWAATFLVLSPEHPLALHLTKPDRAAQVKKYIEQAKKKKPEDRIAGEREKTGVFTGSYAINHVNGELIPIWISDFVIMTVGTGAIQACPGHDMRDFEFAIKFNLPIKRVVVGPSGDTSPIDVPDKVIQAGEPGTMVNSEFLNGLPIALAMEKTKDYFEEKGWGKRATVYHLRDWLISRQRYWGAPIPMIYCKACNVAHRAERKDMPGWWTVPEKDLPVLLPRIEDYKPGSDGVAPLAKHKEFYQTTCPECGEKAVRETDVCDTFLDSSWYFLRYPSVGLEEGAKAPSGDAYRGAYFAAHPSNRLEERVTRVGGPPRRGPRMSGVLGGKPEAGPAGSSMRMTVLENTHRAASGQFPWDQKITRKWLPVNMYTGGAEHSVLHLMYSRFMTMALRDWGYLDFEEPFPHFFAHGIIIKDGAKMSKSKGNVVNPDEYIEHYGADALRLYLMFTGPYNQGGDFRDTAMEGMSRWVGRVWRMALKSINQHSSQSSDRIQTELSRLIKKVGEDIERRHYNTAIASMMEFTNLVAEEASPIGLNELRPFILLLAPFTPYLAEELWQRFTGVALVANENLDPSSEVARRGDNTRKVKIEAGQNFVGSPQHLDLAMQKTRRAGPSFSSVHTRPWPSFDPAAIRQESVEIVVQVDGKLRDTLTMQTAKSRVQNEVEKQAGSSQNVKKFLEGQTIKKTIFVPGRLINFVI